MSIEKGYYYSLTCDECGETLTSCDFTLLEKTEDDIRSDASEFEWREINGKWLCEDCAWKVEQADDTE